MKILIAAKRVSANVTSEGICSSKYVAAVAGGGHHVTCVTAEDTRGTPLAHLAATQPGLRLVAATSAATGSWQGRLSQWAQRLATSGPPGRYAARKLHAACAYGTGYSLQVWDDVDRWRSTLQAVIERERPDVVIVRGAGREFEPHMAMLNGQSPVPWIAHYHDPYPASLYPEPYRQQVPFLSRQQERVHRRIVSQCDALTFPSRRLLEWVLRDGLEEYREKAHVVPHITGGFQTGSASPEDIDGDDSPALEAGCLNIVHTGTLLRERDPRALLRGFLAFVGADPERRRLTRLVFVGRVDPLHSAQGEWYVLRRDGLLRTIEQRVSYRTALRLTQAAECLVIIEANAPQSPFFPAKLADYLGAGKPIVVLSPPESTTADLLGHDYPLRLAPDDTSGVARALERLWTLWRAGALAELAPRPDIATSFTEGAVRDQIEDIIERVRTRRVGRAA